MSSSAARPTEWADRLAKLYTAVVADVLDKLGLRNQCLHPRVRPLFPEAKFAGFALTVQTVPARELAPANPYAGELAAVDAAQARRRADGVDDRVELLGRTALDRRPLPQAAAASSSTARPATRSRSRRWASRSSTSASTPPTASAGST